MYTYIVIDDEELIRKGTIKKLEPISDKVQCIGEATDGKDGIEKIKALNPDIAILDMQMPVMDGTELLPYLSENFPDLVLIVISGYKNFDYTRHAISAGAIDYILKPFSKEAIQNTLLNAVSKLEDKQSISKQLKDNEEAKESAYYEYDIQLLTNLILGYHTDTTSLSSSKLKYINNTHNMVLLTIHFNKEPNSYDISQWLDSNGFGDLALYLPDNNSHTLGFLILFFAEINTRVYNKYLEQIVSELIDFLATHNINSRIGISKYHTNLTELYTAFQESSFALDTQLLNDKSPAFFYFDEGYTHHDIVWENANEFLFRIESGMTEQVGELCDGLFDYFTTIKDFRLADAKQYCQYLSSMCMQLINEYISTADNRGTSKSTQNIVYHIFDISSLRSYYKQFFANISEMIGPHSVYAIDNTAEKIKIYIDKNYAKDLNQDFIASLFYLNRSYLSTMFKNQMGIKFIDYLNQVRIEKAKELLLTSDRKMFLIARAVGYDNVKYFFRIFKKFEGITPEQYRSQRGQV